ncbi:chorismate-binding protein [Ottowia thiooxydans]|uniref:chorismate-binding protein n=1 Tax=Ottowia thiooxydans TaxID=219182 RepID=UPI0003F94420|nr:chorismate-binding protein [Ottowia thiooxydans]
MQFAPDRDPLRPTALIDFRAPDAHSSPLHLAFGQPKQCLVARTVDEVIAVIEQADALARAGAWCVGHISYEAAPAFDRAFEQVFHRTFERPFQSPSRPAGDGVLARFFVYDKPLDQKAAEQASRVGENATASVDWDDGPRRSDFDSAFDAIQQAITDGELYQVNLTTRQTGTFQGDPLSLFDRLRAAQPNAYAAYIADIAAAVGTDQGTDTNSGGTILSVSPELFFDWRNDRLLCSPMKGTAPRGHTAEHDEVLRQKLLASPKERAENVMIVDLLRNDMSRVAEPHSVKVRQLFQSQAWPTVWQLTSDIEARTRSGTSLVDVLRALFPCGSVTGAPKLRAMTHIAALEPQARGVYCGAIGVLQPGGAATFNVPIRTLVLRGNQIHYGVGSGITSDATADGEWAEWRHKRAFAERASQPFELLETLRLSQGTLIHLEPHLDRMRASAAHFDFVWDDNTLQQALRDLLDGHPVGEWRVRLLSHRNGQVQAQAFPLEASPAEVTVQLATRHAVGCDGDFFRHKTTRRAHYDAFAPTTPGVFDTLLWNEQGQLTEFTRGNVALKVAGEWLTPPLSCGLLPGIGRGQLLKKGELREAVLTTEDLDQAQAIAFFNSLRGWLNAKLV